MRNKWMIGVLVAASFVWAFLLFRTQNSPLNNGPFQESSRAGTSLEKPADADVSSRALRIETKAPDKDYTENVILVKKKEVARFKRKGDKIFDEVGFIPDGKIKFVNDLERTYGFENYVKGKLEGEYIEYYSNGRIKAQAKYKEGRLWERKVYYENGGLFSEEDYSHTASVSALTLYKGLKDIGKGKVYRFNGTIKYEWRVTDEDEKFYTKNFDSSGNISEAFYYDKSGALVEHWKAPADGVTGDEEQ